MLSRKLGPEKVLYDKWHDAEFARPNLDEYLANLYLHESDLIVVFLCEEYDKKKWCGLESRVWRELRLDGKDEMIMFLRLDKAAVRGVSPLDGYLPIGNISDVVVAAKILKRMGESFAVRLDRRTSIQKLPTADPQSSAAMRNSTGSNAPGRIRAPISCRSSPRAAPGKRPS